VVPWAERHGRHRQARPYAEGQLREHLGVERWLLHGGSWGATLSLAYAEHYPERVTEIVLNRVTTTRRCEIDWLYGGVARFFPEAWERFVAGARAVAPDVAQELGPVVADAHAMDSHDPSVTARAAADWCAWEDAVRSAEPQGPANPYADRPPLARIAFGRIAAHYFAHAAWPARQRCSLARASSSSASKRRPSSSRSGGGSHVAAASRSSAVSYA
jgi:proline iminopeptidase